MDERATSEHGSFRNSNRSADTDAVTKIGEGDKEEMWMAGLAEADATSQNPVSIIGWAGALALGAVIWIGLASLL